MEGTMFDLLTSDVVRVPRSKSDQEWAQGSRHLSLNHCRVVLRIRYMVVCHGGGISDCPRYEKWGTEVIVPERSSFTAGISAVSTAGCRTV